MSRLSNAMHHSLSEKSQLPDEDAKINPTTIRIAIFDDHTLIREMIAKSLNTTPGFEVVATGQSAADAIAAAEAHLPDVIIMDINMPGDGIKGAREIKSRFPVVKIIMLTSDDSEHLVSSALRAGAVGYVVKGSPVRQISRAVSDAAKGYSYVSSSLASKLLAPRAFGTPWFDDSATPALEITDTEAQILSRLAQGLTNEEIGAGTGLDGDTVGKFLSNILTKLHDCERADEIVQAQSSGRD